MMIGNGYPISPETAGMLILALLGGILLSVIYFGGLWFTVQQMERSGNRALLFLGSFALRLAAALGGFYLIADGRIERLAAALISFFITRQLILRWAQPPVKEEQGQHGI